MRNVLRKGGKMETVRGKMVSVMTKVKQDGSGEYYIVTVTNEAGQNMPQHLCFDRKVLDIKVGETFSFVSNQKGDRHFMNFQSERKSGGGGGGGRKDDAFAKINALIQAHTMPMSYAKDVVVALINQGKIVEPLESVKQIVLTYRFLRSEITSDEAFAAATGTKLTKPLASLQVEDKGKSEAGRVRFEAEVGSFFRSLESLGWVLPEGSKEAMLKRFSTTKGPDNQMLAGKDHIKDMTDAEVKLSYERFQLFQRKECPGDPNGCKYYKNEDCKHYCSWTTRCFYVENSTGRDKT